MTKLNKTRIEERTRTSLKLFFFAILCVSFFIFHIWFRTTVLTQGYRLAKKQSEIVALESELVKLRIERSILQSPENLEKWANYFQKKGLAIDRPQSNQLIYVEEARRQ